MKKLQYIPPKTSIVTFGTNDLLIRDDFNGVPIAGSSSETTTPEESDAKSADFGENEDSWYNKWSEGGKDYGK